MLPYSALAKRTYQPKGEGKLVVELSKLTFGVYVVHVMALNLVYDALMINVFFLPLVLLVTVLISFLFAFAISKIPFVKRLIKA